MSSGTIGDGNTEAITFNVDDQGLTVQVHSPEDQRVATVTVSIVGGSDFFAQVLLSELPPQ